MLLKKGRHFLYRVNRHRLIFLFSLVQILAALLLVFFIHRSNLKEENEHIKNEIWVLRLIVYDALQKENYIILSEIFNQWIHFNPNTQEIKLTAKNGFVIAEYKRKMKSFRTISNNISIQYSYSGEAKLHLTNSLDHRYLDFAVNLIIVAVILTLSLAMTRYLILKNKKLSREIKKRILAEKNLNEKNLHLQTTLYSIGDGVIVTDQNGMITMINPVAEKILHQPQNDVCSHSLDQIISIYDETTDEIIINPFQNAIQEGISVSYSENTYIINPQGEKRSIDAKASPIFNRGVTIGAILVLRDTTQLMEARRKLNWQARHDSLTGFFNRFEMERILTGHIDSARNTSLTHVFIYIDLDQFKIVNDTSGHIAGDELLRQLSHLLKEFIRSSDFIGRLGGDEFGLLLTGCSLEKAVEIAEALIVRIKAFRFTWDSKIFDIGMSLGLVLIDSQSENLINVMKAADMACYIAKESGRNKIHIYKHQNTDYSKRHGEMQWATRITEALKKNQFCLFYQKIYSYDQKETDSTLIEILIRMKDDQFRYIEPAAFFSAAERYHLNIEIDRWIIENSFQYISRSSKEKNFSHYAINISGSSIGDPEFMKFITQSIEKYSIPENLICFEITESNAVTNLSQAVHFIRELKKYGITFAIDDFGTGFASFSYLKNFPADYIKIDGSFIMGLKDSDLNKAIVHSIIEIGKILGVKIIAECVEDQETYQLLKDLDIDFLQGFYLHKPEPVIEDCLNADFH
ncbi:MAG: EAL domain-containing protein [Spirochaetia bacterium]|nr:EAL domain-containing protein [Spirochaetia bacterium]